MDIRPATPADVPAVVGMVRKLCELHRGWDADKYAFRDDVEGMYTPWLTGKTADARAVFLVADRPGRGPVAFLIGTVEREIPIYTLKEYGFIHDLWVEPDYRNEGLGTQIVMAAIERFRQIGVPQVRLDTAAPNDAARKLFQGCGFRPAAVHMLRVME
ncbi:MAG TPA: GNAT family N-acetyltransferase [Tepidisphaeraceae bacterium]|jgi:ribosomal protein S18 acetylase RimI-like enzyme